MYLLVWILVPLVHYAHSFSSSGGDGNRQCPQFTAHALKLTQLDGMWYVFKTTPLAYNTAELKGECAHVTFQHDINKLATAVKITQWINHTESVFYASSAIMSSEDGLKFKYSDNTTAEYKIVDVDYAEYVVFYSCQVTGPNNQIKYNLLALVRKPQPTDVIKAKIGEALKNFSINEAEVTIYLNKDEDCKPKPPPTEKSSTTMVTTEKIKTTTIPPQPTTTPLATTKLNKKTPLPSTEATKVESTTKGHSDATNLLPTCLVLVSIVMSILRNV